MLRFAFEDEGVDDFVTDAVFELQILNNPILAVILIFFFFFVFFRKLPIIDEPLLFQVRNQATNRIFFAAFFPHLLTDVMEFVIPIDIEKWDRFAFPASDHLLNHRIITSLVIDKITRQNNNIGVQIRNYVQQITIGIA